MKNKAAILTNKPPGFSGGVERFNFYLEKLLRGQGYTVDVCHCENSSVPRRLHATFGINQLTYAVSSHARKNKHQYKIIISNGGFGWGLGPPRPHQKFFNIYHGTTAGLAKALRPFLNYKSYYATRYLTDGFVERVSGFWKIRIAVSESVKTQVENEYGLKSTVVNHGIDTNHFKKRAGSSDFRKKHGIPADAKVGLFCGRFDMYIKGIDRLLEVMQQNSDVFWLLAVGGSAAQLSRLPAASNCKIIANAPYEDLPDIYSCADCGFFLSRYEGCGYSLLEALACELPVIATPAGAAGEIYRDSVLSRLLLPKGIDHPAFFEDFFAACRLCADRDFSAAFGARARSIIENSYSLGTWNLAMSDCLGLAWDRGCAL